MNAQRKARTMTTDLTIKTDRLILRPFEKSDLDEVLSYYALPDVQRAIDWYYAQGMIKEKLDAASLVDKRFALFAQPAATQ